VVFEIFLFGDIHRTILTRLFHGIKNTKTFSIGSTMISLTKKFGTIRTGQTKGTNFGSKHLVCNSSTMAFLHCGMQPTFKPSPYYFGQIIGHDPRIVLSFELFSCDGDFRILQGMIDHLQIIVMIQSTPTSLFKAWMQSFWFF